MTDQYDKLFSRDPMMEFLWDMMRNPSRNVKTVDGIKKTDSLRRESDEENIAHGKN